MPTAVDDTEKSESNSKCILIIATVAKKVSIVFVFAKAFPFIAFTALFLLFLFIITLRVLSRREKRAWKRLFEPRFHIVHLPLEDTVDVVVKAYQVTT